ncbi:MAG TPA: anthranilate phosphoribosyltransferase [Candidatus Saccharimonadales bacterium]|nr:anthranilate phosphoribosyltransferase [Candidatus Saccharimonadales bacterium]
MIRESLGRLLEGQALTRAEAATLMRALTEGAASDAQLGALLVALRLRGETPEVMAGFAEVMRERAVHVPTARRPLLDTCGTGGDGSGSLNISTAAALVAAACGVAVAKHGNRSVSSRCGSADVLEALGVKLGLPPEAVGRCVDEVGIGFLFAPALHPAMRHVAPARRELGVRTVFNLLGPLTNPAGADCQLLGTFAPWAADLLAGALAQLGTRRAWVVHGHGGLDELTASGPSRVLEVEAGRVREATVEPRALGLEAPPEGALRGGDAAENATRLRAILSGAADPAAGTVALNAAAALVVAGSVPDLAAGLARAREALAQGRPAQALDRLAALSHEL